MSIAAMRETLTLSQQLSYHQIPDAGFFTSFTDAYARYAGQTASMANASSDSTVATTTPTTTDQLLAQLLGNAHTELSRRREVGQTEQAAYASILNRAYTEGGMLDPQGFLQSLTPHELTVVQHNHCLADPIRPGDLSREGAYNLLLPEGWCADFNHDDLIDVGAAKNIVFPPLDAPTEFLDAWADATRDLDEGMSATYGLMMFTSMHSISVNDAPMQRLLQTDSLDSYRLVIANYLDMLESLRSQLPEGQYERDKPFFEHLQQLLG